MTTHKTAFMAGCFLFAVSVVTNAQAAPPGGPFADHENEMTTQHDNIQTDLSDAQTAIQTDISAHDAEMTTQHGMIQTDISDAQTAIQADIAEVKALVEALEPGAGAPPCGAETEGEDFVIEGAEVCDNTNGLRWQQTPGTPGATSSSCDNGQGCTWQNAKDYCDALGNGFRLPGVSELVSLVPYNAFPVMIALNSPNGPFSGIQGAGYWADPSARDSNDAWLVGFYQGDVFFTGKGNLGVYAWCVR